MDTFDLSDTRVYCGTYHKYNTGSLRGEWLNLGDYGSHDDFMEACRELHKDEEDPGFMFQDREGTWADEIEESDVPAELWDLPTDEWDCKMVYAYMQVTSDSLSRTLVGKYWQDIRMIPCDYEYEAARVFFEDWRELYGIKDDNPLINYVDEDALYRGEGYEYSFVEGIGLVAAY